MRWWSNESLLYWSSSCSWFTVRYLVWLSVPPQVSHCLPQSQSPAPGPVSSPPSGALVAQTCLRPDESPPGSCSGRRGWGSDTRKKKEMHHVFGIKSCCFCYIGSHRFSMWSCKTTASVLGETEMSNVTSTTGYKFKFVTICLKYCIIATIETISWWVD